ncbi:MAG TPA: CDGSH iron-sulfur domain-containing protein [Gemmatales bacterium]|nr:CDGSH iron-sulfur domain-containing protein [Gemmatales bacterium]HMP58412.1 CDGSH iron-sulfur domain-containing protein [Gemmatales bacterium]
MADSVTIQCRENGPFLVQGPFTIVDHAGNAFTLPAGKTAYSLCRCGASKNRPFCDGSHRTCGFVAADLAAPPPPATA